MTETTATTLRAVRTPLLDAIPGLVHGFEQRLGPSGREDRHAARRRVSAALSPHGRLHLMHQVHGTDLHRAPWSGRPAGDVALAEHAGDLLGIETADCLPVLVADPRRRAVAAAHAGWRGTVRGAARAAVQALLAGGSDPADLVAALGPCIGACCYEVGEDVVQAFGPGGRVFFVPGRRDRPHLDVRAANVRQLREAGLAADRIEHVADCTSCRADLYHSYRRDGAKAGGRMISYVGFDTTYGRR